MMRAQEGRECADLRSDANRGNELDRFHPDQTPHGRYSLAMRMNGEVFLPFPHSASSYRLLCEDWALSIGSRFASDSAVISRASSADRRWQGRVRPYQRGRTGWNERPQRGAKSAFDLVTDRKSGKTSAGNLRTV